VTSVPFLPHHYYLRGNLLPKKKLHTYTRCSKPSPRYAKLPRYASPSGIYASKGGYARKKGK
jgi:hypothetical protein